MSRRRRFQGRAAGAAAEPRRGGATIMPLQPASTAGCRGRTRLPRRRARSPRPAAAAPLAAAPRSGAVSLSPQLLPDHAQALLALADGTVFRGNRSAPTGHDDRRGGVQHRAHRLPGNPHRSELLPADRHADVSAHRQLRHRTREDVESAQVFAAGLVIKDLPALRLQFPQRRDRSATICAAREHRRHRRHRHAQADAHPAQRAARRTAASSRSPPAHA